MFVAAKAGIGYIIRRMADLAVGWGAVGVQTVLQGEVMAVEQGWSPTACFMAALAFQTEESSMDLWFGMTLPAC